MSRSQQRRLLNIGMGAALVALAAGVYFSREKEKPPVPLTSLTADAITRIGVRHPDKPEIRLEKQGNTWQLVAPVKAPTDQFQVDALLNLATQPSTAQYPVAEMGLADVGLEPARYEIQLNDATLAFGETEPIEYRRYIRVGETVFLTTDPPSTALDSDYSDLVNPAPIPADAKIKRIKLAEFTLDAKEGGGWAVTPAKADKGADAAQGLADSWRNARSLWRAMRTNTDRPTPNDSAVVTLQDGQELRFVVVARTPQLKLLRPDLDVVYTLAPTFGDELFKLLPPAPAEVKQPESGAQPQSLIPLPTDKP